MAVQERLEGGVVEDGFVEVHDHRRLRRPRPQGGEQRLQAQVGALIDLQAAGAVFGGRLDVDVGPESRLW